MQSAEECGGVDRFTGCFAHKLAITPDAAELLADLIGAVLGRIDNELAKLALAAPSGKITAEEIGQSVAFQRQREMWDLTNALAAGDVAQAWRGGGS